MGRHEDAATWRLTVSAVRYLLGEAIVVAVPVGGALVVRVRRRYRWAFGLLDRWQAGREARMLRTGVPAIAGWCPRLEVTVGASTVKL